MKNFIKYAVLTLMLGGVFAGCEMETTPKRKVIQNPYTESTVVRDDAYYQALREYKKTKHKIAFGWYGSWTAVGASFQTRLVSAPDSMDIISIWSRWHSLTPQQMADKEFVQKIKGTKVTYTIFSDDMPEEFKVNGEITDEGIEAYAKAYCKDSMDKYSYDGIDIDYEPGYGAHGPFVGHDNELFKKLIIAMGKYVGPKSGTGRLFMIDGVPYAVHSDVAEYFDYGIVQAYSSSGYTDLQNRFNSAFNKGWKPEQYIFAENFESLWKTGGVSHLCRDGQRVNSLLGMALFNPTQGVGAGFGAYHMEYEYGHSAKPYKYMREAIQAVNPAGGAIYMSMSSRSASHLLLVNDDGTIDGQFKDVFHVTTQRVAPEAVTVEFGVDNGYVEKYNKANKTKYEMLDASMVTVSSAQFEAGAIKSSNIEITLANTDFPKGYYLIPIVVKSTSNKDYVAKEDQVHYILLAKSSMDIDENANELTGTKIEPTSSWTIVAYQQKNDSGANGVWSLDSDAQKAKMFDGQFGSGWYGSSASWSWGLGGNFIITMDKVYDVTGFRWHFMYQDSKAKCIDFKYSEDGTNWFSLSSGVEFDPTVNSNWKIFKFKKTVKARFIRVYVGRSTTGYTSMDEAEVWTK